MLLGGSSSIEEENHLLDSGIVHMIYHHHLLKNLEVVDNSVQTKTNQSPLSDAIQHVTSWLFCWPFACLAGQRSSISVLNPTSFFGRALPFPRRRRCRYLFLVGAGEWDRVRANQVLFLWRSSLPLFAVAKTGAAMEGRGMPLLLMLYLSSRFRRC
mmetsp:Transcript_23187/g.42749  ORF Transcript_23187/g.42749 Transcript_23187/m.42749 type:complete len:156 (-) Transcript_23187:856-1323(-)